MRLTAVQVAERVERWQERLSSLGIGHVRIECVTLCEDATDVPGDDGANNAAALISENYDSVHFFFAHDFVREATAKELDETILHEWLHVALHEYDKAVDLVRPWMPVQTWLMFAENVRQRREQVVDSLARQLYSFHKPSSHPRCSR